MTSRARREGTVLLSNGYARKLVRVLVASVALATIYFPSAAESQPAFEARIQDYAKQETVTEGYSHLSDESLPFLGDESIAYEGPYANGKHFPHLDPRGRSQQPQESQPLRVEPQVVVFELANPKTRVPQLRGHAAFLLGLIILFICEAAIRSDPAAKGISLAKGVEQNAKSLLKLEDVGRSLLVVLTALFSPFLLVVGGVRLAKTFPAWIKWAKDNDEVGVAHFLFLFFYIWLQFLDPVGS